MRREVVRALSLDHDPGQAFEWRLWDPEHGVLARHGHEWDPANYAGREPYSVAQHQLPTIGDAVASRLGVHLHTELCRTLQRPGRSPAEREALSQRLAGMYDVRPMAALVQWVMSSVREAHMDSRRLMRVQRAIAGVVDTYAQTAYYRDWAREHRLDALLVSAVLPALRHVRLLARSLPEWMVSAWSTYHAAVAGLRSDKHVRGARLDYDDPRDFERALCRYIIYGHTHFPVQAPLCIGPTGPVVYINTGAFRPIYYRTADRRGFSPLKQMTYVIIYGPDEARKNGTKQRAEVWTGHLQEE